MCCYSCYWSFSDFDDQRHVAVLQYFDHAVLVEGNAAAGVGLRAFYVDVVVNYFTTCLPSMM